MKCPPEFRKRVAEQAELARRKAGRGYNGTLVFTYGEVKWILADLENLAKIEQAEREIPGRQNVVIGVLPSQREVDVVLADAADNGVGLLLVTTEGAEHIPLEKWQDNPPI